MSDFIILTEEDSGEEDTVSICREIAQYVACDYSIEPNRGEAIRRAILSCQSPTVLLITGKGAIAASSTRHRVRAASMQHRRNTPTNNTR